MKHISRCLNPQLIDVYQQASRLDELNLLLKRFLPTNFQPHSRAGSFKRGCLTILMADAGWASQVRYLLPQLRDQLREAGLYQLTSIKLVIDTMPASPLVPTRKISRLSTSARAIIQQASINCLDPALQKAWENLARE